MVTPVNLKSAVCINRVPLAHTTAICHQQNMRRGERVAFAMSELIYCSECKNYIYGLCMRWNIKVTPDTTCGDGERKNDDT